jgi:PAS domain S-box-containing protein
VPDLFGEMSAGFMPHGYCLRWDGPLLWTFIVGNAGIAIAYFLIPVALRIFIGKRRDLPYAYMFLLFAAFILSCGLTHIMKIWTLYQPLYWIEAGMDLWTAGVSLATAALLVPIIPKALALRGPKELENLNTQLTEANHKLLSSEEQLQVKVEERTRELDAALAEVKLSEKKFRTLFDVMPQLAFAVRPDGYVEMYNKGWFDYTGTNLEQMQGWGWEKVHDPAAVAAFKEKWQRCLDTGTPFEMEMQLLGADGNLRWFLNRTNPTFDENGKVARWIGIATDIDDQKRSAELLEKRVQDRTIELVEVNERLQDSESKLRESFEQTREQAELLDLTHDTIMVRDLAGLISFWNHGAEEMYGFSREEAVGRVSHDLLRTEFPCLLSEIDGDLHQSHRWDGELVHYAKDGSRLVVSSRWTMKPPDQVLELNSDITQRKAAELKIAVSNNDLQQFAYVASHDLQEPLRTIKSFSDLLSSSAGETLDEESTGYLNVIIDSVGRMQQLVRDLLNYARVDSQGMPLVPVEAGEALSEAILSLDTAIKESGAVVQSDAMPRVMGDKTQLSALFQNLIANAIKFRRPEPLNIHIGAKQVGNQYQFTVTDNGIGLNMEYAERIFVVFQRLHTRTKYTGTGIGLAVCKRIVERHGGTIGVESAEGEGARFWFKLPAAVEIVKSASGES